MARVIFLSEGARRNIPRLAPIGSSRASKVGACIGAIASAAELPGAQDIEAPVPPTGRAYVRRVAGENLWLWYRATDDALRVLALTDQPPIPL